MYARKFFLVGSGLLLLRAAAALAGDSTPAGAWTPLGPMPAIDGATGYSEMTSGRVASIAADPTDANTIYLGAAGGGVWKTTDSGVTWSPLTDGQASLSMGAIAIAPSNRKTIYAGTGEPNNGPSKQLRELRFNIYSGRGILKSVDAGSTWALLGTTIFARRTISRIAIAANNENLVYAAVGPVASEGLSGNTGVWKSADGGATWTNTTQKISTTVPVTDLLIDPSNPQILYASFGDPTGSGVNGVYKSSDAGSTWTALNLGGTQSKYGRISLAIAPSSPQTLFVSIAQASLTSNSLYGLFKSVNGGSNWTRLPISVDDKYCTEFGVVSNILATAGDYHNTIAIDPGSPSKVYLAGLCVIGSNDGGNSWTLLGDGESAGPHHDHHALAFDGRGRLLDGNDGGIWRLDDPANAVWTNLNSSLATLQFQGLALSPAPGTGLVGGSQDNGTIVFSNSPRWLRSQRGDGGATIIDPSRPARVYQVIEEDTYLFSRSLDGGKNFTYTSAVVPDVSSEVRLWYFPMVADPNNSARLLIGTNRLWSTTDAGDTWTAITAAGQNGWQSTDPVSGIAIAASDSRIVYVATGGHIYATANSTSGNPAWTARDLPDLQSISALTVNSADPNNLCAARDIYGASGQVFCSTDGGKTWKNVSGDLPAAPVLSLVVDARTSPSTMYAGTLAGVYASGDGGAHWAALAAGLPNAAVSVLALQGDLLAAGTQGRGVWEISISNSATPPPSIFPGGVVIHAGVSPVFSPGSLADVYGVNLASTSGSAPAGKPLPTTLANAQVFVNGTMAPIIYASPAQMIFQVPYETSPGSGSVAVSVSGLASVPAQVTIQPAAPNILTYGTDRAIVQNPDSSINGATNGAKAGSTVVLYLIGSGPLDKPPPTGLVAPNSPLAQETLTTTVMMGDSPAAVRFAGLTPGYIGLMQINFQIPNLAPGDYSIQVSIGTATSNRALVTVTN